MLDRIAARRAELDVVEEWLAKQLVDVRVERDEFEVAMRAMRRISEQIRRDVSPAGLPRGAKVSVGPLREHYCVG
ncbi:hypothetical protein [Streptomyces sp. LN549]|uniref:hypothetical protein n=1 Tax=Streptomyces sp. LN549 TaxID=3112979 RepID=UPI00371B190B